MSDSAVEIPALQPPLAARTTSRLPGSDLAVISAWFLGLSAVYWIGVYLVAGKPGFSLDDAFIHLQFARNLLETGQMAFNQGVPSSGNTAPGFAFLLAAGHLVVDDWYLASFVLCALCSLGTAWTVYAIVRSWSRDREIARWAGVLTVAASPTVAQAFAGMEPPVYSLVILLGVWAYAGGSARSRTAGSAILALSIWLRPEFLAVLPLILLERLISAHRRGRCRLAPWLGEVIPILTVWMIVVVSYVSYHWLQDRHLVPSTFDAKILGQYINKPEWLDGLPAAVEKGNWFYALLSVSVWPIATAAMVALGLATICLPVALGLRRAVRASWKDRGRHAAGRRLAVLLLIGYPLIRGIVEPMALIWFQQQRYYAHLTPLAILVVLACVPRTGAVVKRWGEQGLSLARQRRRTIAWALGFTALMGAVAVISVGNINDMQVEMAHWLVENTAEDDVVATNDIGAIGFITQRRILDTVGLVEPGIVDHFLTYGSIEDYVRARDPAYIVIYENWYPELVGGGNGLRKAHSVSIDLNVVCGGSELVAFRPSWAERDSDLRRPDER